MYSAYKLSQFIFQRVIRFLLLFFAVTIFSIISLCFALVGGLYRRFYFISYKRCERYARVFIAKSLRVFWHLTKAFNLINIQITGLDNLPKQGGYIVIANHPTLIDALVLISILPNTTCVAKAKLLQNFIFGSLIRTLGYIENDGTSRVIDRCIENANRGETILIFPEGTRSPTTGLNEFSRGTARIALRAKGKIVPIIIRCKPLLLGKQKGWKAILLGPIDLSISICYPLSIERCSDDVVESRVQERRLTRELQDFFTAHAD